MDSSDVKVVVLLSAWGTGSTSVAGFLDRCGVYTCPPHQRTRDERTPISYEPVLYRNALGDCLDEHTLKPTGDVGRFVAFLEKWLPEEKRKAANMGRTHIALKHPLQTFVLPTIDDLAEAKYVVVTRPFRDIENTRQRRRWHAVYGEAGARTIYNTIYSFMHEKGKAYLTVPYRGFIEREAVQKDLLRYLEIDPVPEQLSSAQDWLKPGSETRVVAHG